MRDFYIKRRTPSHKGRETTTNDWCKTEPFFMTIPPAINEITVMVSDMTKQSLGSSLRAARTRAGIKQQEAAAHLNVDRTTIYTWEKGEIMPSLDKAIALAKLYNVTMSELVGEEDITTRRLSELEARMERLEND